MTNRPLPGQGSMPTLFLPTSSSLLNNHLPAYESPLHACHCLGVPAKQAQASHRFPRTQLAVSQAARLFRLISVHHVIIQIVIAASSEWSSLKMAIFQSKDLIQHHCRCDTLSSFGLLIRVLLLILCFPPLAFIPCCIWPAGYPRCMISFSACWTLKIRYGTRCYLAVHAVHTEDHSFYTYCWLHPALSYLLENYQCGIMIIQINLQLLKCDGECGDEPHNEL